MAYAFDYTKKIKIPKFEPNDDNVALEDCINVDRYIVLLKDIDRLCKNNKITEEEAKFLKLCATRWIKFDYENVAQYYATKASKEFQKCLEKSAMVLIDIDKAFENTIIASRDYIENISKSYIAENIDKYQDVNFDRDTWMEDK